MKRNAEIRLLIKILAIVGFAIMLVLLAGYVFIRVRAPQLLEFSKGITAYRITVKLDSLEGAKFITGMEGCENVLPDAITAGVYVSCLDGYIHFLEPDLTGELAIKKSFKAGEAVMGMAFTYNHGLIAAVCKNSIEEWSSKGGALYRFSRDLSAMERLSEDFPSMNGICVDHQDNLYFASSNFKIFNPEGMVWRMSSKGDGNFVSPEPYIRNVGLANGLYYDERQAKIFFSNTTGGIYEFTSMDNNLKEVYLKLKFMEVCDDLCTDISGNVWMTNPGLSTVKMFNPGTNLLAQFNIEGFGQASSCRIRSENGLEMIYITELKQSQSPLSGPFDGRGVLVVPAQSLLRLLEPLLIK
jgi:sugar lactone lactonase YvrE